MGAVLSRWWRQGGGGGTHARTQWAQAPCAVLALAGIWEPGPGARPRGRLGQKRFRESSSVERVGRARKGR